MIYVVEDDSSIRELLVYTLNSTGFSATGFAHPAKFLEALQKKIPDLVILDLMLPDIDGMEVLKRIRSESATQELPVMIVSAKDTEFDKICGLDSGADDYMTKPFGMMELISRVKVQLRRKKQIKSIAHNMLKSGSLLIDETAHRAEINGNPLPLTLKEFELLVLLMHNPDKVFTRDQLLDRIWGISCAVESRTVDVHIRTLRMKLGEMADIVETVRGVGYRMGRIADKSVDAADK